MNASEILGMAMTTLKCRFELRTSADHSCRNVVNRYTLKPDPISKFIGPIPDSPEFSWRIVS